MWTGVGVGGLLAVVVSVVAGLALVGGVARGLGAWPVDRDAAASSGQAADGSTTSRVTFPDGGTATVHLPPEDTEPQGAEPQGAAPRGPSTRDDAGAEAAARAWVDAYSRSFAGNDPGPLEALSGPGCTYCARAADSIRWVDAAGWRYSGTSAAVVSAQVVEATSTTALVHVEVAVAASSVEAPDGGVDVAGGRAAEDVAVVWSGDRWLVAQVDGPALALDLTGAP